MIIFKIIKVIDFLFDEIKKMLDYLVKCSEPNPQSTYYYLHPKFILSTIVLIFTGFSLLLLGLFFEEADTPYMLGLAFLIGLIPAFFMMLLLILLPIRLLFLLF